MLSKKAKLFFCGVVLMQPLFTSAATDCTVSGTGLAFGFYDVVSATEVEGTGEISISCTKETQFEVKLSTGQSNDYAVRHLNNGTSDLFYNLYTSKKRNKVWGDGSNGTNTKSKNKKNKTFTIYGTIFSGQTLATPGSYTDTLLVTVEF